MNNGKAAGGRLSLQGAAGCRAGSALSCRGVAGVVFAFTACGAAIVEAQTTKRPALTLAGAKQVLASALQRAAELQAPGGTVAIVDEGGHLMLLERMENTFAASPPIAVGKARTAALFGKPTKFFEDVIHDGRTSMVTLPDFTPLQGGVPLIVAGQTIGAIGVSGAANAAQDHELAEAGAAALSQEVAAADPGSEPKKTPDTNVSPGIMAFSAEEVSAAWEVGRPLLETAEYKVHASRRDRPGQAEQHLHETDVGYVVSGRATLVTGGRIVDEQTIAEGEVRGSRIEGGDFTRLTPGAVFVVPRATPHWFCEVDGPFLYFVVKPIASTKERP